MAPASSASKHPRASLPSPSRSSAQKRPTRASRPSEPKKSVSVSKPQKQQPEQKAQQNPQQNPQPKPQQKPQPEPKAQQNPHLKIAPQPARRFRKLFVSAMVLGLLGLVSIPFGIVFLHASLLAGQRDLDLLRQDLNAQLELRQQLLFERSLAVSPQRIITIARDELGMVTAENIVYLQSVTPPNATVPLTVPPTAVLPASGLAQTSPSLTP